MTQKNRSQSQKKADRDAVFHPEFREDLRYWVETDRKSTRAKLIQEHPDEKPPWVMAISSQVYSRERSPSDLVARPYLVIGRKFPSILLTSKAAQLLVLSNNFLASVLGCLLDAGQTIR